MNLPSIMGIFLAYANRLKFRNLFLLISALFVIDLLVPDAREAHCDALVRRLGYTGPVYHISAASGEGCRELCQSIMNYLEERS